jgi:ABC-type phosphate transport system substrate-binding protein
MNRRFLRTAAALAGLAALMIAGHAGAADFVIIVNKENSNPVDADYVGRAFRGDVKTWPSGEAISALALPEANPLRVAFDKEILGKAPNQTKAMWSALVFTGKAAPPKVVDSEANVVKTVAENKNAIGYVSAGAAGSSVKVVK